MDRWLSTPIRQCGPVGALCVTAAVVATAAAAAGCGGRGAAAGGSGQSPSASRPAPSFSDPTLGGSKMVSLKSLRGHAVLLTSWATWCTVCRTELPAIQTLADAQRDHGLRVVGVNIDTGSGSGAESYARQHGLTFLMLHDANDEFQADFNAVGVPTNVLIDPRGRVQAIWPGALQLPQALSAIKTAERS